PPEPLASLLARWRRIGLEVPAAPGCECGACLAYALLAALEAELSRLDPSAWGRLARERRVEPEPRLELVDDRPAPVLVLLVRDQTVGVELLEIAEAVTGRLPVTDKTHGHRHH